MKSLSRLLVLAAALFAVTPTVPASPQSKPTACPCGPSCACDQEPCTCVRAAATTPAVQPAVFVDLAEIQPIVPDDTAARIEALERRVAELTAAVNRLTPPPQEQTPLRVPATQPAAAAAPTGHYVQVCTGTGCAVVFVPDGQQFAGGQFGQPFLGSLFGDSGGSCGPGGCAPARVGPIRRLFGRR